MASRKQQIYADFSDGYNDSVAEISIKDTEVCISENADYSAEIKAFSTRKGCTKVNDTSFSDEVTDAHMWYIGSKDKQCLVIDSKLYDFDDWDDEEGEFTQYKIALTNGKTKIYPFVVFNKFYFGDGAELYVWGDYDYSSEQDKAGQTGTTSVAVGKIVRNNTSTTGSSEEGHFYKCLVAQSNINLSEVDYSNTSKWEDVTEVPYFASNVVRVLSEYDPSQKEKVRISVISGASNAGTIGITLNNVTYEASIPSGASVSSVLTSLMSAETSDNVSITEDWDIEQESNTLLFTKKEAGLSTNGYADPGSTGCVMSYVTEREGKINDNNLDPIKKCTMFIVHTSSYRVFAAGNPEDNALFYSEIGNPAYFKSDLNKVYALSSYGKPTGMLQLTDSVLISFENGWYAWDGITPLEDATWKPLNNPYGCVSHRSIALTPYSFMYLGKDGIYNVSASIVSSELVLLQGEDVIKKISSNKVDKTIGSISNRRICEAVFYDNVYYLAYNTDGQNNDEVLKFEWNTKSYTKVTGWKVNAWLSDSNFLYFATKNYLLRANDSYSDIDVETGNVKPIDLYIKTKEYHFGNPFLNKVCRLVGFIFKQLPGLEYDIGADIKILMGYKSFEINTINITESLVWGRNWGHLWGFREAIAKMVELTEYSNTFQIEIRNSSLNSPITLVAIGFVYDETDYITPTILKDEDLLV